MIEIDQNMTKSHFEHKIVARIVLMLHDLDSERSIVT